MINAGNSSHIQWLWYITKSMYKLQNQLSQAGRVMSRNLDDTILIIVIGDDYNSRKLL